jgi:hypothetical protein
MCGVYMELDLVFESGMKVLGFEKNVKIETIDLKL